MKIAILFVFLLTFLALSPIAKAQNTFDCNFDSGGDCVPVNNQCNPGFDVDPAVCSNSDDCQRQVNNQCKSVTSQQERCSCITGTCTPDANGSMLCSACNSPTANAACTSSQPRFKCANPQVGCEPCTLGSPGCTLSASDCVNSCTPSTKFYKCNTSQSACVECSSISEAGCTPLSTCQSSCTIANNQKTSVNVRGNCPENNIDTAIGCIPFNSLDKLSGFFIAWGLGVGGGVAMFVLIASAFMIITSAGDTAKLQTGKEMLTSAVAGIIFLVFSMFLLRVIGINVLGLF